MRLSEMRRERLSVIGAVLAMMMALPVSWWTLREETAEAQNPMGDAVTMEAAESGDTVAAVLADAVPSMSMPAFASSAAEATACMARHRELLSTAAAAQQADSTIR